MARSVLAGVAILVVGCGFAAIAGAAESNSPPEGFTALFNGKDLTNWVADDQASAHWKVEEGVLHYDSKGRSLRTEKEYAAGHVPGAILIPHDELASRLDELAPHKDGEIVVHCKSGRRAGMAEEVLAGAGFSNVVDLEGHWNAWEAGGHPTE